MSVVLHISDTHFGAERPTVVDALLAMAQQQGPDLVVLSGDVTQRARPAQFQAAKAFVDRLGVALLLVPGNHDIPLLNVWARLTRPYADFARVFGDELEPVHCAPDLLVVGVNTTRAHRHRHGEVSDRQIARVAQLLRSAQPHQLRLVVVHQPAAVIEPAERCHLLRGHDPALRIWAAAGADAVLGGHIHQPYTLSLSGLKRRLWVVQAGSAVSSRTRAGTPNSVNLLRWEPPRAGLLPAPGADSGPFGLCRVERWDFHPPSQSFQAGQVSILQPERNLAVR